MTLSIVSSGASFANVSAVIPPATTGTLLGYYRNTTQSIGKNLLYGGATPTVTGSPVQQTAYTTFTAGSAYMNTTIPDSNSLCYLVCARGPNASYTGSTATGPMLMGTGNATGSGIYLASGGTGPGSAGSRISNYNIYSDGAKGSAVNGTGASGQVATITSILYNGTTTTVTLASSTLLLPAGGSIVIAGNTVSNYNGTFTITSASAGSFVFTPTSLPSAGTTGTGGTGTYTTPAVWLWKFYGIIITPGTGYTVYDITDGLSSTYGDTNSLNINTSNSVYIGSWPTTLSTSPVDIAFAAVGTGLTLTDLQTLRTFELPRLASFGITA